MGIPPRESEVPRDLVQPIPVARTEDTEKLLSRIGGSTSSDVAITESVDAGIRDQDVSVATSDPWAVVTVDRAEDEMPVPVGHDLSGHLHGRGSPSDLLGIDPGGVQHPEHPAHAAVGQTVTPRQPRRRDDVRGAPRGRVPRRP